MKEKIKDIVYNFFVNSSDFNGIPLCNISKELNIDYTESIDFVKELVREDIISIQSSINPHIIRLQHNSIDSQIQILEDAKTRKVVSYSDKSTEEELINYLKSCLFEEPESQICLYPSKNHLTNKRNLAEFGCAVYSQQLALAEPQLKPIFFEMEILEKYFNDPRFDFEFEDYSGKISCLYNQNDEPIVREEDQIFLNNFGLGYDENGNRLVVVYLIYLNALTPEHQFFWKSKEKTGNCKVVEEYHQNTIQGEWTFSHSIFSAFLSEQKCINDLTELIFSKPIFRETFEEEKRPKEFTFFFTPTLKNYQDFILLLDKMISENINKDFFKGEIEFFEFKKLEDGIVERTEKGTLRLFEDWLTEKFNISEGKMSDLFKVLKEIREERQSPAHKINENKYDPIYIIKQKKIMKKVWNVFRNLRNIFHQHPKVEDFEIPHWLENGDIKIF